MDVVSAGPSAARVLRGRVFVRMWITPKEIVPTTIYPVGACCRKAVAERASWAAHRKLQAGGFRAASARARLWAKRRCRKAEAAGAAKAAKDDPGRSNTATGTVRKIRRQLRQR